MALPKIIMGLILYIVVITFLISTFASNMGYTTSDPFTTLEFTPPSEESMLASIPVFGGWLEDAFGDTVSSVFDTTSMVGSAMTSIAGILVWTIPEEIFPLWANIIFVKIPLIALIIAIVDVLLP